MSTTTTSDLPEPSTKTMRLYLLFMMGQLVSLLGSGIVQFAIIWWITITYQNAAYLSIAAVLGFGPTLIVGLFAGVFVDRWNRRALLATVDSLEAIVSMVLVYFFWVDMSENFMLYAVFTILTLRAIFQGFHGPAIQAIIPLMVPRDKLSRINSLEYLSNGILGVIGPVIAAVLLGFYGLENIEYIILLDMATFLIAVMPLLIIRIPAVRKINDNGKIEKQPFKEEFKEGFVFIKQKKGLLALLSAFATSNFFSMPLFVLLPLIVSSPDLMSGDERLLAYAFALAQVGTIAGSLLMTIRNPFSKNTTGVFFSLMLGNTGTLLVMIGALTQNTPMFFVGMLIVGTNLPLANVSSQNIWQVVTPPEKMGRVFAVRRTIAQVSAPLAMILVGIFVVYTGITALVFFSVIAQYIVLLYIWFMTGFTRVESDLGIKVIETQEVKSIPTETVIN